MKKMTKRFFSLLLACVLVFGALPTNAFAAPTTEAEEKTSTKVNIQEAEKYEPTEPIEISLDSYGTFKLNTALPVDEDVVVDEEDPAIIAVEAELKDIKVLNADGEPVPLTQDEIDQVLALYQQYLDNWAANANILGVQTPFFLSYNDDGEDGLGILGEMLVLAGESVDAVRAGYMTYDDLTGMIMNFLYGDMLGVQFYGNTVAAARDEALAAVEASGAQTESQKLLVLNDWLAHVDTFDMPYIMNGDAEEGEEPMVAADPQEHQYHDAVYDVIYDQYEDIITDQFHDQIYESIKADLRQQYYEAAIEQGYYQAVYEQAYDQVYAAAKQQAYEDALAAIEADEQCASLTTEEKEELANQAVAANDEDIKAAAEEQAASIAESETDTFMTDNADAIAEDPAAFCESAFGEEAAAQIAAGADDFVAGAEKDGIEVAEGVVMTVEELTQQTMANEKILDLDEDGTPETTANDAIPLYAAQAAEGLTEGVLNYWEGTQFGALVEGKSVCLGYAKAYAYLVQYMHPEIYGVDGASTDLSVSENWKTAKDLYYTNDELDITKDYAVDLVRITFDASVTMYGETQDNFNSDHFWNAVQIDGTWYYVDPCYTDVFTEVMSRDRVETDGSMNHLYFLFSHESCVSLYDGNYSEIKSLYDGDGVTGKNFEDTWFARAASNTYFEDGMAYYVYDSTDLITLLDDYNNSTEMDADAYDQDAEYKLVGHKLTSSDKNDNGDTDYTTYIEFNYKEDEDAETSVARILNADGEMEENELLTKLYAQHEAEAEVYPSIAITAALYDGKLYFNLSNCILYYDLSSHEVALVKEYNTVSAVRDDTNPFGGMAFTVTEDADNADFTVENHPIAGMTIKEDGNMYVSIATNFAFISGKDPHNSSDQGSYGYEFEESNYNSNYNTYSDTEDYDDSMLESFGYEKEINDNDEFMWTANFVDTVSMSHLAGTSHSYKEVSVDAYCGRNAYTEERCTTCGAINPEVERVEEEGTACEHHYIYFEETYYTKSENDNWNEGFCYVCTMCGTAVEEPTEPDPDANYSEYGTSYEEQMEEYEKEKAIYDAAAASAGHTYTAVEPVWAEDLSTVTFSAIECSSVCKERQETLDCLREDKEISVTLSEEATLEASVTDFIGECTEGGTAVYTATGEAEGYTVTVVTTQKVEPGTHAYDGEFTWTEVTDEDGNATGEYTVTADLTCVSCGDVQEGVEAVVTEDTEAHVDPTCTETGKDVLVATATVTNEDGDVIGTATSTKELTIPANGHTYVDGFCSVCGEEEPDIAAPELLSIYSTVQTSAKATWTVVDGADGYELWRATAIDAPTDEWSLTKTIKDGSTDRYTNQNLEVGTTYYYKVRAYKLNSDDTKVYSEFSEVKYMPAAVVFENVYSNATFRIRLLWKEINGAHGYQIWRLEDDGETWKIVKTIGDKGNELTDNQGATTAYSNTGLEAGKTYTYKMRAFAIVDGKKIFGAYSDEFSRAVKPETPEVTVTSSKEGRAVVEWDTVSGAAGYQIWMSESENGTYTIVKSITDGSTSTYTKYDLTSGKKYYFKVRAYSEVNDLKSFSDYSDIKSVTVK